MKVSQIQSKLPDVGTTIFAVMSKMAKDYGAINLSQGFPDFEVSPELIGYINRAMEEGKNQYAPMTGIPELRESISGMIDLSYGYRPDVDLEITVTAGATEAIFSTVMALVHQDDKVIILDPAYDCYAPSVRLAGGIPCHVPLSQPEFSIDWDLVRSEIDSSTRLLMINSPHNPSGAVLTDEDLDELERIVLEFDLLVLSDEVYEHIIFDHIPHRSVLKRDAIRKNSAVIFSFGKTFHATGWKVGYCVAPPHLTKEIRRVHQFVTFTVNTSVQWGLARFASKPENYQNLNSFYQSKRDYFLELIKNAPLKPIPCHGTYFQLLSYADYSDLPDMEMAEKLTKEHKVASIPISVFYANRKDDRILRFCFAKNNETLEQAAQILCKL